MTTSPADGAARVAITNAVLSNTGDAAICEALIRTLVAAGVTTDDRVVVFDADARSSAPRYPAWRIHQQLTVSPPRRIARVRSRLQRVRVATVEQVRARPALARRLLGLPLVRRTRFAEAVRALDAVDVVVSSGGTYLVDHYDFGPRVVELELAASRGVPVVLWTQSLGPFCSERARAGIERLAPGVDAVWFRDPRSATAWAQAAPLPPVHGVVPDVVLALPPATVPAQSCDGPPTALVSMRTWGRGTDGGALDRTGYEAMMRAGVVHLRSAGWRVRALSTCQGVPRYVYDDSAVAADALTGTGVEVDRGFHTPGELLDELAGADLVVSTRMHLAILALVQRVPVIAVAYEFKTLELFRELGLGDLVVPIEEASEDWLRERIDVLRADPDRGRLDPDRLADLAAAAAAPARALRSLLDPSEYLQRA